MLKKDKVEIPQLKLTFKVNNLRLTEKQKLFLSLALHDNTNIMFVSGPAGSTKTYMAVYAALRHLSAEDDLDMFYVRTVIESADKGLGALPGKRGRKDQSIHGSIRGQADRNATTKQNSSQRAY